MADPRIIQYVKQNMGQYPIEALRQALIQNGFPPAEVDQGILEATGRATAPTVPPLAAGDPTQPAAPLAKFSGEEGLSMGPGRMFANAAEMARGPRSFFSRLDAHARIGPSAGTILAWGAVSGALWGAFLVGMGTAGGALAAAAGAVLFPFLTLLMSFLGAGIYHVLCKLMGGQAPFRGTYAAFAAMAALMPVSTLLNFVPFGPVLGQVLGVYLSVQAAVGLHRVGVVKAWAVLGTLGGLSILLSVAGTLGMRRVQRLSEQGRLPEAIGQALGVEKQPIEGELARRVQAAQGGALPADASQALAGVQSMLGDPALQRQFQQAMAQAGRDSGSILQDLARYGDMKAPPRETLALLDAKAQRTLREAWPALSAPIRRSIAESLPQTPAAQRGAVVTEMLKASKALENLLNQSGFNVPR